MTIEKRILRLPGMVQKFLLLQAHNFWPLKFLQEEHKWLLVWERHIWKEWNDSPEVFHQKAASNLESEVIYSYGLALLQLLTAKSEQKNLQLAYWIMILWVRSTSYNSVIK